MQKTPITIEKDLEDLEKQSEEFVTNLIRQMEGFFAPVTDAIDGILNPLVERSIDQESASLLPAAGGKTAAKAPEPKKAPAKPPAKGKAAAG